MENTIANINNKYSKIITMVIRKNLASEQAMLDKQLVAVIQIIINFPENNTLLVVEQYPKRLVLQFQEIMVQPTTFKKMRSITKKASILCAKFVIDTQFMRMMIGNV